MFGKMYYSKYGYASRDGLAGPDGLPPIQWGRAGCVTAASTARAVMPVTAARGTASVITIPPRSLAIG